jgi:hypothetical protein
MLPGAYQNLKRTLRRGGIASGAPDEPSPAGARFAEGVELMRSHRTDVLKVVLAW